MRNLRIAIVEDEMIIADDMNNLLLELGYQPCGIATSYEEALLLAKQEKPTLFLLDITLRGSKNGFDIAVALQELAIPYVFVTSHHDTRSISQARELHPYGYLIKPFTKQDLFATIEMALGHLASQSFSSNLFVATGTGKTRIDLKDILYVKANGNYVEIKTESKRIVLRKNLKEFESKLRPDHPFLRVHKSYLVNRRHIISYNQTELLLKNDTKIPMGRTYFIEIRTILGSI